MATYGKYYPSGNIYNRDKVRRRHSAIDTKITDCDFGVQLSTIDEQKVTTSNDQPEIKMSISQKLVRKAIRRLRDALLPQVGGTRKAFRIIWVLIYIGLMTVFLCSFFQLTEKYFNYPTTNDMTLTTETHLEFPAVTVCNENPVRKSMIGRYRKFRDLIRLDKYVTSYVDTTIKDYGSIEEETYNCSAG